MATAFGPQLIGETEKTLNALLRRHLADTGLTEPQWVTLRLADQLGDTVAPEGLVDAVRDRADFDDADDLVGALSAGGLLADGRLTTGAASCSRVCRRRSRSTPRRSGPTFRPTTSRRRPGCSTRSSPAPVSRSPRSAILWRSKGSIPAHGRRHHGSEEPGDRDPCGWERPLADRFDSAKGLLQMFENSFDLLGAALPTSPTSRCRRGYGSRSSPCSPRCSASIWCCTAATTCRRRGAR